MDFLRTGSAIAKKGGGRVGSGPGSPIFHFSLPLSDMVMDGWIDG
jgi:hypothetical protein